MTHDELIGALRRLKVETGSLACLGCGREHNCSTQGCAILREAVAALENSVPVVRCRKCKHSGRFYNAGGYIDCAYSQRLHEPDFYCADGERREEDT